MSPWEGGVVPGRPNMQPNGMGGQNMMGPVPNMINSAPMMNSTPMMNNAPLMNSAPMMNNAPGMIDPAPNMMGSAPNMMQPNQLNMGGGLIGEYSVY